MMISETNVAIG